MWSLSRNVPAPVPTPLPVPTSPPPQQQYVNVGNGNCVGRTYPVDSAADCAEAAETLWAGQGCYGREWANIVQSVDYPDQPQGCMLQLSAWGGCALLFYARGAGTSCPRIKSCEVVCVE